MNIAQEINKSADWKFALNFRNKGAGKFHCNKWTVVHFIILFYEWLDFQVRPGGLNILFPLFHQTEKLQNKSFRLVSIQSQTWV